MIIRANTSMHLAASLLRLRRFLDSSRNVSGPTRIILHCQPNQAHNFVIPYQKHPSPLVSYRLRCQPQDEHPFQIQSQAFDVLRHDGRVKTVLCRRDDPERVREWRDDARSRSTTPTPESAFTTRSDLHHRRGIGYRRR